MSSPIAQLRAAGRAWTSLCVCVGAFLVALMFAAQPAHAGDGRSALRLLPRDTAIVLTVNASKARTSVLGRQLLAKLIERVEVAGVLQRDAGLDMNRDIDTVVFAMAGDFERTQRFVLAVEGRFDREKLLALVQRESASFAKKEHAGTTYALVDGDVEMGFVGNYLVLAHAGEMTKVLDAHGGKQAGGDQGVLGALVRSGDTQGSLWLAVLVPESMKSTIAKQTEGHSIHTAFASAVLTTGITLKVRMKTSSANAATAIALLLRGTAKDAASDPMYQKLGLDTAIGGMAVSTAEAHINVAVELSALQLAKLYSLREYLAP